MKEQMKKHQIKLQTSLQLRPHTRQSWLPSAHTPSEAAGTLRNAFASIYLPTLP